MLDSLRITAVEVHSENRFNLNAGILLSDHQTLDGTMECGQ